jgi:two-component system response regulator DesR
MGALTRLRVAVAEDQALLRASLERLLAADPGLELVASAADLDGLESALAAAGDCADVALVDLWMPERVPSGFDAPRRLRRRCPGMRLLALSASLSALDVKRAFACGFDGYSTKDVSPRLLAERIRLLAAGKRVIDPEVAHVVLEGPDAALDAVELALLQALALGRSHAEAAASVHLGERQARRLITRVCRRLGAESPTQAVAVAVARGLIRA